MNTRRLSTVASALLLGLFSFAASRAQASSEATVTVCNKGRIDINVVIGTEAPLPLFVHNLDVQAWISVKPGACSQVYHGVGDYDSGSGILPSYIGFGFYNTQKQLTAGHAARLPDLGYFTQGTAVLTAASDRFCVRTTSATYTIREHAVLNCATFRSGANDPGGYTSLPTVLRIFPRPWGCDSRLNTCYSGDFFLDVIATPTSSEIQITGRVGKDEQSNQSTRPDLGSPVLKQLLQAARERHQGPIHEPEDSPAQAKARAEATRGSNICVPDDMLAEWRSPQPGSKMEAFQSELKETLRQRAKLVDFDQTKWMTLNSSIYSIWHAAGRFQVATATVGGSCAVGHHEYLPLSP